MRLIGYPEARVGIKWLGPDKWPVQAHACAPGCPLHYWPTYEEVCCRQCGGVDAHTPACRWAGTNGDAR